MPWDIYLMPTGGGAPQRLTQLQADMPTASWGRDAAHLAVMTEVGIFQASLDGNPPAFLAPGAIHGYMSWYDH